jgi:hypothetical protein
VSKLTVKEKRTRAEKKVNYLILFVLLSLAVTFAVFGESGQTLNPFDEI